MKTAKLNYSANEINALLDKIKNDVYTKDEQLQCVSLPSSESFTFFITAKTLYEKYTDTIINNNLSTFFVNKTYIVQFQKVYSTIYGITFIDLSGDKYALTYEDNEYFDLSSVNWSSTSVIYVGIAIHEQPVNESAINYVFGKEITDKGMAYSLNYIPIINSQESQTYGQLNKSLALIALREASKYLLASFMDTADHQLNRSYFLLSYFGFSGTRNFAIVFVKDFAGSRYMTDDITVHQIKLTHAELVIYDLENNNHIILQTDHTPRRLNNITLDSINDGFSSTTPGYIIAKPLYVTELEKISYNNSIQFVNGYSNKSAYINIYREGHNLSIIVAGQLNINQSSFVVGAVQTPLEFTLDEETSRKLFVGDSNTAAGNIAALPGLYYNDQNYQTTVVPFIIRRKEENGNVYQLRFTGSQLTSSSTLTDLNFRLTLALD